MWARFLFHVRRALPDLGVALGSWRLSVVLMVLAALYHGLLAIWATSSPPHVVQNIARLAPFWVVYGLLLTNTALCLWRRLPALRRDLSREPALAVGAPEWRIEVASDSGPAAVSASLRQDGYAVTDRPDGSLWGLRRRYAALGTYLFHGSFFLIALGFALTALGGREASVWVAVGEAFQGAPEQVLSGSIEALTGVPVFRVEEIAPEYWGDQLLFTRLEARLEPADGDSVTTRINRPLWFGWGTFLRLSGFGYAPRYEIADRSGRVLDSAFVKMRVFPPGQRDSFVPELLPHRIYVQVLPDHVEGSEPPATRSLNLVNPAMPVDVYRGKLHLGSGLAGATAGYEFEGLTLTFPETRYWGEFSVVRAPGVPVLFAGFALAMLGLAVKLRGGRAEVVARQEGSGTWVVEGFGSAEPPKGGLGRPGGTG